ncbi:uncharacterized protein LOC107617009 [Arachis ipaensis]|uniref:uncharacterized protein LOC107617009 n=1 Tax=Arachis ipaensis TaxID=130454 RepID=UPI0007AF94EE|nr:uncharacterized protein LOC107617009 [Arachis ipaensis]XP_025679681.1 uncharacterized protein LOC112779578 [Arachis hypogaea]
MLPSPRRAVPPSLLTTPPLRPSRLVSLSRACSHGFHFRQSLGLGWMQGLGGWPWLLHFRQSPGPGSGKTTLLLALTGRLDHSLKNLLKLDALSGRNGAGSQPMPRAKQTLSRVAVTRTLSEKYSDFSLPTLQYSKEQSKSCEICRRFETF